MLSAMLYFVSLFTSTRWSTESKALEKSISKHRTYLLSSSIIETVWVISISADVVLPVGLKPYWSKSSPGGIVGDMWSLTTRRSNILDSIGVTDIGLRSPSPLTGMHLGTGITAAVRQADGRHALRYMDNSSRTSGRRHNTQINWHISSCDPVLGASFISHNSITCHVTSRSKWCLLHQYQWRHIPCHVTQ